MGMEVKKCAWCSEEIEEEDTLCPVCQWKAMDDIEREEANKSWYEEEQEESDNA
jgi:RNA polymerase subunit RPABC4/transcription elongation factor Spt4